MSVDPEELRSVNAREFGAYWPKIEPLVAVGESDVLDVSLEVWRRTLRACGFDDDAGHEAFVIHQRIGDQMARLFEDVSPFVDGVEASDLKTALVTNSSPRSQSAKVELMGLTSFFDTIVISGSHGIVKPDPGIFEIALTELDCDASEAWHVGDNLATDVAGANAAGVVSVWLDRDGLARTDRDPVPDIEISSLAELSALLNLR